MRARDWDEDYIYGLAVQEYDDIEFKASPLVDLSTSDGKTKVMDSLAREISALANYGGGFLVLGVKDPKDCKLGVLEIVHGGILKEFQKPNSTAKVDTAEWLRQNIANMTEHKLLNYEVHAIERKDNTSNIDTDKAVFVIEVPDSPNAPFQNARDNKYYMRVGGNSEPASHRMVLDIMGRRQHPDIQVAFLLISQTKEKNKLSNIGHEGAITTYDQTSLVHIPINGVWKSCGFQNRLLALGEDFLERLSRPSERMCALIPFPNERLEAFGQMLFTRKIRDPKTLSHQNRKPLFDLVHP